ncbi:tetratricopeptide repeat protein [Paraurantiacibacter namhicola]|uniref:Putative beta-lactamase HcpC n=1 Tax=Paraurantiacibacter namhicola TaxID=645517 RepID=A0A1C7D9C9_9SPHN|nr:SEL1-like repeat protein [Paraurantiacibacter namhicola]ANU08035.1 Putative beta-lactamase HcpC precursor [Paraurantiacibacter namhicola]
MLFRAIATLSIAAAAFAYPAPATAAANESELRERCMADGGDPQACTDYGYVLVNSGDPAKAKIGGKLLTTTCQAGFANACFEAGKAATASKPGTGFADWEIALSYREACDMDHARACTVLALMYMPDSGSILNHDQGAAIALLEKACRLREPDACTITGKIIPAGRSDPNWKYVPAIDPSLTAPEQMKLARSYITAGGDKRQIGITTVARLQQEGWPDAHYEIAMWFRDGKYGFDKDPAIASNLFYNAGTRGHVEGMIELGMAYWYGQGREENQQLGLAYMRMAAVRGSEKAQAIYRNMLYEPVRQENARQAQLAAERAKQQRWASQYNWSSPSYGSWSPSRSNYDYAGEARRQREFEARQDRSNWNNAMRYHTGGTSACLYSNPYC